MKNLFLAVLILVSSHLVYAQSDWQQLNSGVSYDLTSIFFVNDLTGLQ